MRRVVIAAVLGVVSAARADVVSQIDTLVRTQFYAPALLAKRGWDDAVRDARAELARAPARRAEILGRLMARLATSHTDYVAPDDPRHAQLLSIFGEVLTRSPDRCPDRAKLPALPVEIWDAGVWWAQRDGRWFVAGVLDGGPGKAAGLLVGDEVVSAGGQAFQPVTSFARGGTVALAVRRRRAGALRTIPVALRRVQPQAAFREAIGASARMIEHAGKRIGYVRVWSWAGLEMQDALEDAIDKLNGARPDGFVIDLRDGWGGAAPDYLRIFHHDVPVIEFVDRAGKGGRVDRHIHVPAAVLINGGSRSGKEVVAYGIKKKRLATLVGERTAGAVVAGGVYCLEDGALLYLASSAVTIDGEVLEGKGVEPDVKVPFDLRYAEGRDPQIEAALGVISAP